MIPVFVDGALPNEPTTRALLAACSQVVQPETCVLSRVDGEGVARVTWANPLQANVDVTLDGSEQRRSLTFQPIDLPESRWQTVGLVLGALLQEAQVSKLPGSPDSEVVEEPLAPDPPPLPSTEPHRAAMAALQAEFDASPSLPIEIQSTETARPASPGRARLSRAPEPSRRPTLPMRSSRTRAEGETDETRWRPEAYSAALGGLVGTGLSSGPARLGAWGELELRLWHGLGLAGIGQVAWLADARDGVGGRWWTVGLGPSFAQPMGQRVTLSLRASACREQLRLTRGTEAQTRTYSTWQAGVGLEASVTGIIALVAEFELAGSPGHAVNVEGDRLARNPRLAPAALLGMKVLSFGEGEPDF